MWGNYTEIFGDRFHGGLNSDYHSLLINKDTLMTGDKSRHTTTSLREDTTLKTSQKQSTP